MEHLTLYVMSILFLVHFFTETSAQTATAPAPAGPTNITAILEKAGQYTVLMRLLKSTQVGDQINNQLNNSNVGFTIFAPTDNAFSNLSPGTLNSLTDQQKTQLIQFHILPNAISMSQFQTVSNPLRTQAGDASNGQFPLNVTTMGNQVNITTGVVNTTVSNTIYSDDNLVVYQVDEVLLPLDIFGPHAPAPAPSTEKKKRSSSVADGPSSSNSTDSTDTSTSMALSMRTFGGLITFAAAAVSFWWSF